MELSELPPVSLIPSQVYESIKPIRATDGRKCAALLTNSDPLSSLLRTLVDSPIWHSRWSLLTWTPFRIQSRFWRFRLRLSARRMQGCAFLSWPTPTGPGGTNQSASPGAAIRPSLEMLVKSLPTPCTTDAASAARHTTTTGVMHSGTSLTDAIRMVPLPTPNVTVVRPFSTPMSEDGESSGNRSHSTPLNVQVRITPLATPQAHDAVGGKTPEQIEAMRKRTGAGVRNLCEDVKVAPLSTPQAADHKKGSQEKNRRSDDLPDEINLTGANRGLLNPEFVEAMMGFPIGWSRFDGPSLLHSNPQTEGSTSSKPNGSRDEQRPIKSSGESD